MNQAALKPATGEEIRKLLGSVDDDIIAAIMKTGASSSEVGQAFEWLCDDDYMGADLQKPMNNNIRRVYELLQADRDSLDPHER